MARIRSIKPEFPQSESMGNVSRDARLTFLQLWTIADDEGRLRGNSRMLASLLFPYDGDATYLIDGWLDELEREHCILRYKNGGQSYVQICNWLIHQKIDKASKSKIPPFDESSRGFANVRGGIKEGIKEGKGEEGKGEEGKGDDADPAEQNSAGAVPVAANPAGQEPSGQNPDEQKKVDEVAEIFSFWQKVMNSPKSVLDTNRKGLIQRALKDYTPAQLCKAIRGCSKSPHNMGRNEQNTRYNGLGLILRNAEKIERFMQLDDNQAIADNESLAERNARILREVMQGAMATDDNIIDMEA